MQQLYLPEAADEQIEALIRSHLCHRHPFMTLTANGVCGVCEVEDDLLPQPEWVRRGHAGLLPAKVIIR